MGGELISPDKLVEEINRLAADQKGRITHVFVNQKLFENYVKWWHGGVHWHDVPVLPDMNTERIRFATKRPSVAELLRTAFTSDDLEGEVTVRDWLKKLFKDLLKDTRALDAVCPFGNPSWMDAITRHLLDCGVPEDQIQDTLAEMADAL